MHQAYGDDEIRRAAVFKWWTRFRDGETNVKGPVLLKLAANGLRHVFEKWVERRKKCIACHMRQFEKETATTPPQSSGSE
jgi:hypothetical protein